MSALIKFLCALKCLSARARTTSGYFQTTRANITASLGYLGAASIPNLKELGHGG